MPNANTFLPPTPVTPGFLNITNITRANQAVVTITNSNENTYIVGQLVYLSVPASYGMYQINAQTGQILAINGTQFTLNIDTTSYDTFVIPSNYQEQPATLSPSGSRNIQFNNFTNNVPFKSLNNIGN